MTVRTGDIALEPERAWREVLPEAGEKPGEYLYDLGGQFPVERVRFALPQQNTIARVELLSRPDPHRDWQFVTSSVIYRLMQQGHQVSSPDLAVATNTNRYWLVRADQKGGGLGSGLPRLSAGWVPQKLVFAARGKGPFQIAYGSSKVQPAAYPIDTVVPGWRSDQPPKLAHAEPLPERLLGGAAALHRPVNYRVFGLWGALVLGVLLLGWMAWRLSKQMQSPPSTEATEQAGPTSGCRRTQNHARAALERGDERVPGQRRAIAARRESPHYSQHRDFSQIVGGLRHASLGQQRREATIELARLRHGAALHRLGHHRRRRHRDPAARALEAGVADHFTVELHVNREAVAAKRVDAFRHPVVLLQHAVVARVLDVIEHHTVVKVRDCGHEVSIPLGSAGYGAASEFMRSFLVRCPQNTSPFEVTACRTTMRLDFHSVFGRIRRRV